MLAVVKTPRIEIAIHGEGAREAIKWLARKYEITVISQDAAEKGNSIAIEDTDFWKEMQANRTGNLLEAARLKAGMTQKQLGQAAGIRQNMVSDYENGRRRLTRQMRQKLAAILGIKPGRLA